MRARVFKFLIHLESGKVCCGTKKQRCWDLFLPPFSIFLFSISHSNVIHRKFVSKISEELLHREFWNLVQMLGMTYCIVKKIISMLLLIIPFICPFFFLSNKTFRHRILHSYYSQSLQICVHLESGQEYCGTENQDAEIYFYHLFPFSISHSNVIHREICVKDFSGTTAPRVLKFGTNIGYDLLYCVKENQHAAAYYSLYLSIFLSLQ